MVSHAPVATRQSHSALQFWGLPYIYTYTLFRRTTKFDVVTQCGEGLATIPFEKGRSRHGATVCTLFFRLRTYGTCTLFCRTLNSLYDKNKVGLRTTTVHKSQHWMCDWFSQTI